MDFPVFTRANQKLNQKRMHISCTFLSVGQTHRIILQALIFGYGQMLFREYTGKPQPLLTHEMPRSPVLLVTLRIADLRSSQRKKHG